MATGVKVVASGGDATDETIEFEINDDSIDEVDQSTTVNATVYFKPIGTYAGGDYSLRVFDKDGGLDRSGSVWIGLDRRDRSRSGQAP